MLCLEYHVQRPLFRKRVFLGLYFTFTVLGCDATSKVEQTKDKALAQLKMERDVVNEQLENAKTKEEYWKILDSYTKKVEEYSAKYETTSSTTPPPKNIGDESRFLSNEVSNLELRAFKQQKHRLRLDGCTISYNERSGSITTIASVINVLGDDYERTEKEFYQTIGVTYLWPKIGVFLLHDKGVDLDNTAPTITFDLSAKSETSEDKLFKGTLLLQGVPLHKDKAVASFIENSKFTFDDINPGNSTYRLFYDCYDDEESAIKYSLDSDGIWNYKGGGHLMLKDGINKENTYSITSILISKRPKNDHF